MPELTDDQHQRAEKLLARKLEAIEEQESRIASGTVVDSKRSTAYYGLALTYQSTAIVYVMQGRLEDAQTQFIHSAQRYNTTVQEARQSECDLNTFKRIPMTLTEGLFMATLGGHADLQQTLARAIIDLHRAEQPAHSFIDEPIEFITDKFYLARCIAGVIVNHINKDALDKLKKINTKKGPVEALYGHAVIHFVDGIDNDDPSLLKQGTESMLEYHERQLNEDDVIDLIMAPQATALAIIARQKGYNTGLDSEFIPEELVEASLGRLS